MADRQSHPAGGISVRRPGAGTKPKACLFWACAGLAAALAAVAWRAQPSSGQVARPRLPVAEIRFGVIEPPVVAQRDITVRAPTSNQQLTLKPLECSGIAWLDGGLVLSSDRHGHVVFTCAVDLNAMTIALPVPHVVIRNEQELLDDAESITVRTGRGKPPTVYVLCSLSNDRGALPLPKRRHMLRFVAGGPAPLAAREATVLDAGTLRRALHEHLKAVGVGFYRTYYAEFPGPEKNTYRWGNVEGMTFTPDGSRLLCGMRNPLLDGAALMFAVEGVERAFQARDSSQMKVTDLYALDLGRRGVSDLFWDPRTRGYLIAAAKSNGPRLDKDQPFPPNTLDSALFWWSGRKSERPVLFAKAPDMKIEAICRLGDSRFIAICSDEGDVSESREQRQSVLTIIDFTGLGRGK